jgi:hypothetical protein
MDRAADVSRAVKVVAMGGTFADTEDLTVAFMI